MSKSGSSSTGWRKVLQWPAFLAANLAILLLVGISTARETYRGWTVDREIQALDSQAHNLEDRKLKLVELTSSLSDPQQIDLQARERLGWKKDGERVVVLSGWQATSSGLGDAASLTLADVPNEPLARPNPEEWFRYFFSTQN